MEIRKNERGSLTVEAAVALPLFICAVISIIFFIKLVYVHELIQHAITQSANEVAAYSYLYSVSGVEEVQNTLNKNITQRKELFERHIDDTINAYHSVNATRSKINEAVQVIEGDEVEGVADKVEALYRQTGDTKEKLQRVEENLREIAKDPRQEVISMLCFAGKGAYEDLKAQILIPIVKVNMGKYLKAEEDTDLNERLKALSVVDGLKGLDFSESALFDNNEDIDIILRYRVKLALPFNVLPELNIIQRATVRAWLDGENNTHGKIRSGGGQSSEDIWAMAPLARGRKIQEMYGRNMRFNYPVVARFEADTNTAVAINSIDLRAGTYQKAANIERLFQRDIERLEKVETVNFQGQNYTVENKKLIIVVPKGTLTPEIQELIVRYTGYANQKGVIFRVDEL